jgi:hypothetical protein
MLLCSVISGLVYGQDTLKVTSGRFTTELNINPFIGELSLNNALNQIKVRYFLADNTALRIGLSLSTKKSTSGSSSAYGSNPFNAEDERKTSTVGLNFGFEKHFKGTKRLSPYLGAELAVASKSSSQTLTSTNQSSTPSTVTTTIKGAWQTTSFNNNGSFTTYDERAFFQYGLNIVGGFDFYVARNFFIGYEIAYALLKTNYKNIDVTTTPTSNSPRPDISQKDFTFSPSLINGIRVGFVF